MRHFMTTPMGNLRESGGEGIQHGFNAPIFRSTARTGSEDQKSSEVPMEKLTVQGIHDARSWGRVDGRKSGGELKGRWQCVSKVIRSVSRDLSEYQASGGTLAEDEICFLENSRLLQTISQEISNVLKPSPGLPVVGAGNAVVPRVYAIAVGILQAGDVTFTERTLSTYIEGIQQFETLRIAEVWALKSMLQHVLLEQIAAQAESFSNHR
jgi:hypothetical protein